MWDHLSGVTCSVMSFTTATKLAQINIELKPSHVYLFTVFIFKIYLRDLGKAKLRLTH